MLKFALIGCGVVARKHLQAARYNGNKLRISALVDSREDSLRGFMANSNLSVREKENIDLYTDTAQMLDQIKPDLTAITTPSGSHYDLARAALEAGSHIIVEKPLTLSLDQADELLALAEKNNRKIAVGHIYRFFPLVQLIQEQLQKQRWGRILYGDVKVRWGHDQAYYDQARWRGTWQHDGGALMNQSIHALDLMLWLLGERITTACGLIDRQSHNMEAEDLGLAAFRLENGIYCTLEGTTNTDPRRQEASFFICCEKAEIRAGIMAGRPKIEIRDREGKKLTGELFRKYITGLLREHGFSGLKQLKNPHSFLYRDMIRAIFSQATPLADGVTGRQALEAVLAVYKSALLKKPVDLPLADFELQEMKSFFPDQKI